MTKKQYTKPQVIELGDAIKTTLAWAKAKYPERLFRWMRVF
jgi:hypothetical protein